MQHQHSIEQSFDHISKPLTETKASNSSLLLPPIALPPTALYLTYKECQSALNKGTLWLFEGSDRPSELPESTIDTKSVQVNKPLVQAELVRHDIGGKMGYSFITERQKARADSQSETLFSAVARFIKAKLHNKVVIIACLSEGSRQRLMTLLSDEGLTEIRPLDNFSALIQPNASHSARRNSPIYATLLTLNQGFELPDLCMISEQDILGERHFRQARSKRSRAHIAEMSRLTMGELVVHIDYGIGRFLRTELIETHNRPEECAVIEYAGGDMLYVPLQNIVLLTRYGQGEAPLDRMDSLSWQARKAIQKKRFQDIAKKRHLSTGPICEHPPEGWDQFCADFAYPETDDQLSAIDDVVADMASGTPMERLICGDVGFGKTEVAMRAAFIAVMNGFQVAVIAPTTLLARQHL